MLMRARGFSLVEFMIAMTIGLFLIAGLVYLIAETSRSRAEIERSSRQIENGRYALDRIAEDLRHAGFYGEYFSVPSAGEVGFPASLTAASPCGTTLAALVAGMPLAIQAYDGGASVPSDLTGCIAAADYQANTDILVVRRASTSTIAKTEPLAPGGARYPNQPYIQTTPVDYKLDFGSGVGTFTLTLPSANTSATYDAPLHRYIVRIYFISRCNVPSSGVASAPCDNNADGGSPIPTLKMMELGINPASGATEFQKIALAEGIEHLEFDFGIDTTGDGVADVVSQCTTGAPCTAIDFSNVVTVQVNIVARNTEASPAYYDDKTYSLGAKGYTPAPAMDHYRRHSYSALVRLNNIAMRRD
jgi:type IV pilus assembly protein PilW